MRHGLNASQEHTDTWTEPPAATTVPLPLASTGGAEPPDRGSNFVENLLWLPYVLLTLAILLAFGASFARFHMRKRKQYQEKLALLKNLLHTEVDGVNGEGLEDTERVSLEGGGGGEYNLQEVVVDAAGLASTAGTIPVSAVHDLRKLKRRMTVYGMPKVNVSQIVLRSFEEGWQAKLSQQHRKSTKASQSGKLKQASNQTRAARTWLRKDTKCAPLPPTDCDESCKYSTTSHNVLYCVVYFHLILFMYLYSAFILTDNFHGF